ncbi:hypothetical protein [Vacuolonema iberomarrocanum]|uniref:hypothetical protein n=1 Tax=Vacuolonema iberomarrocanum TaxID=3454632 RepID=UPI0019EA06B4|nr:hypothetical protein [filamentous cyanobacterium LEGE 07170]
MESDHQKLGRAALCPQLTPLKIKRRQGRSLRLFRWLRINPQRHPGAMVRYPANPPSRTTALSHPFQLFNTFCANIALPVLRVHNAPSWNDRPLRHNPQNLSRSPLQPSKPMQEDTLERHHQKNNALKKKAVPSARTRFFYSRRRSFTRSD